MEARASGGAARTALGELAVVFLKLGVLGFGGPAAHVALMEDELVRRRGWLTRERFLDLLGAANLVPGPNSTELAIHIGRERGGWRGLAVAGTCFIAPAFAIVLGCAWVYVRYGTVPAARGLLYGVKPVMIAVVLQAVWGLGRTAIRTSSSALVGSVCLGAALLGVHELAVLLAAGTALAARAGLRARSGGASAFVLVPIAASGSVTVASASLPAASVGLVPLSLVFLKTGSILFGSGYVLLAYLRADLVHRLGWLSDAQLLDAIAVGQLTPGPVLTTATFVGYILAGVPGATVATVGIFLPAFVFVALSGPLVPLLRRSSAAGGFLDGVNVASLALMAVVGLALARAAVVDWPSALLAAVAAALLLGRRVSAAWLVPAGAIAGLALSALR
jgi:chromate transporter